MIKISHEVPNKLLKDSWCFNDYGYALLHLRPNEEYWNFYKESIKEGKEVLLDNSAFELGDAMSNEALASGVEDLNPTWFVVPDALNDTDKTISRFESWEKDFKNLKGSIGVVQGQTIEDMIECYKFLSAHADKIAIPCEIVKTYRDMFDPSLPLLQRQWMGRTYFIMELMKRGVWNYEKPHHLLGATQVKEFMNPLYKMKCFDSLDTSNPIVAGLENVQYGDYGLEEKSKVKLATLIDSDISHDQLNCIIYNVKKFKEIVGN